MKDVEIQALTERGAQNGWAIFYAKAYNDKGELFFPEKLNWEDLKVLRRDQGSYIFANQYLNEIIPDDKRVIHRDWIRYYEALPQTKSTFAFIDPACSLEDGADYTGLVIIDVGPDNTRYVRVAQRFKILPTKIMDLIFRVQEQFKPTVIGVEAQIFQSMIVLSAIAEMKATNNFFNIQPITRGGDKTKEMRIMGLMPRLEWGNILFSQGLRDLEDEMLTFPRGSHDDLLDALESVNAIAYAPQMELKNERPNPNSPEYEAWYRRHGLKNRGRDSEGSRRDEYSSYSE